MQSILREPFARRDQLFSSMIPSQIPIRFTLGQREIHGIPDDFAPRVRSAEKKPAVLLRPFKEATSKGSL